MELIAASRIVKAQQRVQGGPAVRRGAHPGAGGAGQGRLAQAPAAHRRRATRAGPAPAGHQRPRPGRRLQRQRDQGRPTSWRPRLRAEGKEPVLYVIGRKGVGLLPVPPDPDRRQLDRLLRAAELPRRPGRHRHGGRRRCWRPARARSRRRAGIDELHIVYTRFESMVTQTPTAAQVAPVAAVRRGAGRSGRTHRRLAGLRRAGAGVRVRARARRSCWPRCCRSTSGPGSSRRCWSPRPRSRRPGGAP